MPLLIMAKLKLYMPQKVYFCQLVNKELTHSNTAVEKMNSYSLELIIKRAF